MIYPSIEAVRKEMWRRRKLRFGAPKNIVSLRPPGTIRNVTDEELLNLLATHTQKRVGEMFGVTQKAISMRLTRHNCDQFALRRRLRFAQAGDKIRADSPREIKKG